VEAITGRTHQIRVHLASLGTPIVGDFKYGVRWRAVAARSRTGCHLHARSINIAHPDGGRLLVTVPCPHMQRTWKLLGFDAKSRHALAQGERIPKAMTATRSEGTRHTT